MFAKAAHHPPKSAPDGDGKQPLAVGLLAGGAWTRRNKPRRWLYATSPRFVRLADSLGDSFKRAREVHVILDLGEFQYGDICLEMKPDSYYIVASNGSACFAEEILVPKELDLSAREGHFKDGILEIVLRRKDAKGSHKHRKPT